MNNRQTGSKYEELATKFLTGQDMRVIARNFRCRQGEIDLIGIHLNCLVFIEVKYRKNNIVGSPEEAVGERKQLKICQVSDYYRMLNPTTAYLQVRYDVVAISGEQVNWYQNAFPYRGGGIL